MHFNFLFLIYIFINKIKCIYLFFYFKHWTKSLVRIEAISCFPCYIQISLNKSINKFMDNFEDFTIKINIPGLTAELVIY